MVMVFLPAGSHVYMLPQLVEEPKKQGLNKDMLKRLNALCSLVVLDHEKNKVVEEEYRTRMPTMMMPRLDPRGALENLTNSIYPTINLNKNNVMITNYGRTNEQKRKQIVLRNTRDAITQNVVDYIKFKH
jgi:calcineurin-like phosphoesterase family protein